MPDDRFSTFRDVRVLLPFGFRGSTTPNQTPASRPGGPAFGRVLYSVVVSSMAYLFKQGGTQHESVAGKQLELFNTLFHIIFVLLARDKKTISCRRACENVSCWWRPHFLGSLVRQRCVHQRPARWRGCVVSLWVLNGCFLQQYSFRFFDCIWNSGSRGAAAGAVALHYICAASPVDPKWIK